MPVSERLAFGDFVLERSQQRVLQRDGTPLNLTPRLFSALLLFAEHVGELLDKDTLMTALWPGLVVEENNLSQVISGLRRALGDDTQGSRYIQTVPRRGFRFIATVTVLPEGGAWPQTPAVAATPDLTIAPPADFAAAPGSPELALPMPTPTASQVLSEGASEPVPLPSKRHESDQSGRRHWLGLTLAAGLASSLAGAAWWVWRGTPIDGVVPQAASRGATLAVLPFKPLVATGRDELLEVGMADSLIARLSTVPNLVVRSIGSVLRYGGIEQDPLRAARELDVTWILDGSLQRHDDQLRVTARLLRSADGVAAWSGSFDEEFTGVFAMQDLISNRVMQALAPTLLSGASAGKPLGDLGGTRSTEAYQLYLAANHHAQSLRADGLRKSRELLNQALTVDPAYALAWVALAEVHRRRLFSADAVPTEVFEPIKIALQRALAVAPNLAQARTEVAFQLYWFDFDWPAAEREFRRALALNPNVAMAHFGLGMLLVTQDRLEEGFLNLRLARELDPMSPLFNTMEAGYLIDGGRRAEARTRLARVFDIAPNFWLAHATQGLLYFAEQQPGPGIASLRRAVELTDGSTQPSVMLAVHLVRVGQPDEAREILNRMLASSRERYVPPTSLAAIHAVLGEVAPALDLLELAVVTRDTRLIVFKDDPRWARLRKEPRFTALLHRLRLDQFGPGLSPP